MENINTKKGLCPCGITVETGGLAAKTLKELKDGE